MVNKSEFGKIVNNIKQEPPVEFNLVLPIEGFEVSCEETSDNNSPNYKAVDENQIGNSKAKSKEFQKKQWRCVICEKLFETLQAKNKHIAKVHSNIFSCNECPLIAKSSNALLCHKYTHTKRYSCETCDKRFSHNNILRDHQMHQKHGQYASLPEIKFTCEICKQEFASHYRWHAHQFIMHCPKKVQCDLCGKTVINREYLRRHMFQHLKSPCAFCDKLISKLTIKRHILYMHTETPSADCEICKKKFKSEKNLKVHVKRIHSSLELWKCNFCVKKFRMKGNLKTHLKNVHKDIPDQIKFKEL